jgi:CheY-like chemotaxis protein/signal transduction histidine kinase
MLKIKLFFIFILGVMPCLWAFQTPDAVSKKGTQIQELNHSAAQYIANNQLSEAENDATVALAMAQVANIVQDKAVALENLGMIARARFDYTNAMNYFVEALKLKESVNDKRGVAVSKNNIGQVYFMQKNENQALANYQAALGLLGSSREDLQTIAETHRNIGDVYLSQKIYGKAIQEFDEALKIWSENLQDFPRAATLAAFLGKVNFDIKDNDGALNNFNASLNFHRMLNDESGMASDNLNLSKVYNELGDNDLAIENAENALAAFEHTSNLLGLAEVNCQLGKIYLKNNDAKSAETFFEKSGAILRGVKFQPTVPLLYKNIAEGFLQLGNTSKAYAYLADYATSKDSLFDNEKNRALVEMTTKYESEFAIKDKNRQLANFEKEKNNEMILRWLLIGLVSFAFIALWLTFRNYRLKKRDNEQLAALNTQIQIQNDAMARQNDSLEAANIELSEKNTALDLLNSRLVEEVAEREMAQNAHFSKDHYLADVSARMRDPLSILVSEARQLMAEKPRKDQEEPIKNLQFATNNLLVLINDVLNFSNIDAGKLMLAHQEFDTYQIFEEVKQSVKPKKNVTIETEVDNRLPQYLKGDSVRFIQILNYLTAGLQRQLEKGTVKLLVHRNDLIDNELMMKIELLTAGDFTKNEVVESILRSKDCRDLFKDLSFQDMEWLTARRLIELQNGTIQFEEQADGLQLTVYLPFKMIEKAGEKKGNAEDISIWANNDFLEGKRILVVEDNKINQMLVKNMLQKRDVLVTTANDGLDALDALATADFDLILMDIQMPRMDGYRAVAEIRRLKNPVKSGVPIIALTASAYINEKEKAQLFGMTDHIGKPFSPDELLEKVIRVLMTAQAANGKKAMALAA